MTLLEIDGSMGEGGGQILRSALSLSAVTGTPFRIENVRAGRSTPGLRRQHLTAVRAAREVARARVEGAEPGSTTVVFRPEGIRSGTYRFSTGGAGSCTLVLQTVLWPLLAAAGPSTLSLEGGTHNPFAPPFDFMERALLPLLDRMGADAALTLERAGFYPAGGGRLEARIEPLGGVEEPGGARLDLRPLVLERPGPVRGLRARAYVSALPRHIGERELDALADGLGRPGLPGLDGRVVEVDDPAGPGNAVVLEVEREGHSELFTGFGRKGVPAEEVAAGVVEEVGSYLASGAAVGPHLADQLLLPLALGRGGVFTTPEPTPHFRTNARVVGRFLDVEIDAEPGADGRWRVRVGSPEAPGEG